jgi:hypothetical protein
MDKCSGSMEEKEAKLGKANWMPAFLIRTRIA